MMPYWIFATALLSMLIATSNLTPFNSTDFSSETFDNESSSETFTFEDDSSAAGRVFILVNGTLGARPNYATSITLIGFSIFLLWGAAVQNYPLTAGRLLNSDPLLFNYNQMDHSYLNETI